MRFYLAGVGGIEPTNAGIKIQCLTTWRHPNKLVISRVEVCGWGGRDRTYECWNQNPVPYHLATPQSITSMYSKDAGLNLPHNRLHNLLPLVHKPREPLLLFHMPKTHKHLNLSSAHDQIDSI